LCNAAKVLAEQPQTVRCPSQNPSILPKRAQHHLSRQLTTHIRRVMFQEIGPCWGAPDPLDQWEERVQKNLPDGTEIFAPRTLEPDLSSKLQRGGVGVTATFKVRHRMTARGKDPSGVDRWAWMRASGKEGRCVSLLAVPAPWVDPALSFSNATER
jgi:hypothetical protein